MPEKYIIKPKLHNSHLQKKRVAFHSKPDTKLLSQKPHTATKVQKVIFRTSTPEIPPHRPHPTSTANISPHRPHPTYTVNINVPSRSPLPTSTANVSPHIQHPTCTPDKPSHRPLHNQSSSKTLTKHKVNTITEVQTTQPIMTQIWKSPTDLIRERAMQARLPSKLETDKLKAKPTDQLTAPVQEAQIQSEMPQNEDTVKKMSSEFALVMQDFILSESDDDATNTMEIDSKLTQAEESEAAFGDGDKESDIDREEQPALKMGAIDVEWKTRAEAQSDVDSCLTSSVGTLSPTKLSEHETATKSDASNTEKDVHTFKSKTQLELSYEKLIADTLGPRKRSRTAKFKKGNHSNCYHGMVVSALVLWIIHYLSHPLSHDITHKIYQPVSHVLLCSGLST